LATERILLRRRAAARRRGWLEKSTEVVAALHPVGALVLFGIGVIVARRARRFLEQPADDPLE